MHIFPLLFLLPLIKALDNGLGLTPPLGWNTWNKFHCDINETIVKTAVQRLIATGLRDKGYKYINLDDCWQISRDPSTKQIQYDKTKFPSGIQSLIDYVHGNGFLFGLYSDAGEKTCQGRPGSYGYEGIDAKTYAKWNVDYLKYDNCFNEGIDPKLRYPVMRDALNATKRPIYFSMCEWGREKPYLWAQNVSNSWRTTMDIKDNWYSFLYNLEMQRGLSQYAKPGAWNDPDMLEVGNGGMSHDEYQSHFALWAVLKSPLLIGCDLNTISEESLKILGNEEMIAVNQDKLGKQGDQIQRTPHQLGWKEIWGGELSDNRFVVVFFNASEQSTSYSWSITQHFKGKKGRKLRDIINHKDIEIGADQVIRTGQIRRHACQVYIISF